MAAGSRWKSPWVESGEESGIATAKFIPLDFKPIYIEVVNTTAKSIFKWYPPHGAAGHTSIVCSGAGTTDVATATSNGLTVGSGGFTMGTAVQTLGDVVYWLAFRAGV